MGITQNNKLGSTCYVRLKKRDMGESNTYAVWKGELNQLLSQTLWNISRKTNCEKKALSLLSKILGCFQEIGHCGLVFFKSGIRLQCRYFI